MAEWALLSVLTPQERERLLAVGHRRHFATGEIVFHEGDPADAFHLLMSGRVAVRVVTPNGDQALLTVLVPGEAFGELALLGGGGRRTATISALEPTQTLAVGRAEFDRLRKQNPSVDTMLLAAVSAQVERLSEHLLEVLFVPARARILRRLLTLTAQDDSTVAVLARRGTVILLTMPSSAGPNSIACARRAPNEAPRGETKKGAR